MLNDKACAAARPGPKPYKLADAHGLYLFVTTAGGKLWRYKFRFQGKEKLLALGAYPAVPLAQAREAHRQARAALAQGTDPSVAKQRTKQAAAHAAATTFQAVALEWHREADHSWTEQTADRIYKALHRDLFPDLGALPIATVTAPMLLSALRKVTARGAAYTAEKERTWASQIFRYAIATERAERDPAADLKGALKVPATAHRAAATTPAAVAALLRAIHTYQGTPVVRTALQLQPMLFPRPGELRAMRWDELDLDAGEWRLAHTRMKGRQDHIVPLPTQAVALLHALRPITGSSPYVFAGPRTGRPLSDATLNRALQTLGYDTAVEQCAHGFRATARTLLHETMGYDPVVIEHQLAHQVPDALGAAYNRTRFLLQRREMMQRWADYLDSLRDGATVVPIFRQG